MTIIADAPSKLADVQRELDAAGYARLSGGQTLGLLGPEAKAAWDLFSASWDHLGEDLYMADGGRYRRRRHATFGFDDAGFTRRPHQPHFQSRDYNPLNGDVQRWFDPVDPAVEHSPVIRRIFTLCAGIFPPPKLRSHVELHQFRIETSARQLGRPTPEGLHRDGVDWVFVMLVTRRNVREGVTEIGTRTGERIGRFILAEPGDAILLNDHRILHGVTEIHAVDPALPAYRDVLVVTFVEAG
jgi:hypothetical protein